MGLLLATIHPGLAGKGARMCQKGFTLAELLIALAILGEIATFTIPKIINAQQIGLKKAVFKETIGALSSVYWLRVATGELNHSNAVTYIASQMNAIKLCPTNSSAEGCINSTKNAATVTLPGFTLPNGAQVWMYTGGAEDFLIDWNGDAPPNLTNDDIIHVYGVSTAGNWCNIRPGAIAMPDLSVCPSYAADVAYYQTIFQ